MVGAPRHALPEVWPGAGVLFNVFAPRDPVASPLNVVILVRKPGVPDRPATPARFRRFGNPDDFFVQSRPKSGLITQSEVRSLAHVLGSARHQLIAERCFQR